MKTYFDWKIFFSVAPCSGISSGLDTAFEDTTPGTLWVGGWVGPRGRSGYFWRREKSLEVFRFSQPCTWVFCSRICRRVTGYRFPTFRENVMTPSQDETTKVCRSHHVQKNYFWFFTSILRIKKDFLLPFFNFLYDNMIVCKKKGLQGIFFI
jgi:hypothetical protein